MSAQFAAARPADMERQLLHNPATYLDLSIDQLFALEPAVQDRIRLQLAQRRLQAPGAAIEMVQRARAQNEIETIAQFDDLVPLLFSQETYKSYPQSWLEAGDFKRLTKWLGKLTSADLSRVDASRCELIEEWIAELAVNSEVDLLVNAGADGKAAFQPRTRNEWNTFTRGTFWLYFSFMRDADGTSHAPQPGVDRVPMLHPGARHGTRSWQHNLDRYEAIFGPDLVVALPDHNDADLLSLAGRIKEASRKGDAGSLQINPKLIARKSEIAEINATKPQRVQRFMERMANDFRGKRIFFNGTMQMLYDLGQRLREMGKTGAYAADSYFFAGGGFAGATPANWKRDTAEALGVPESAIIVNYGMIESLVTMGTCPRGHYHVPVTTIPFLLDLESEKPLPRTGTQTGRYAFFDTLPETSWGGYVSSDLITIHWDAPCACGRKGPHVDPVIQKVAVGQDDKIGCAGTANALDDATDFLIKA